MCYMAVLEKAALSPALEKATLSFTDSLRGNWIMLGLLLTLKSGWVYAFISPNSTPRKPDPVAF